jgi:hypothetical protein
MIGFTYSAPQASATTFFPRVIVLMTLAFGAAVVGLL